VMTDKPFPLDLKRLAFDCRHGRTQKLEVGHRSPIPR
jgi:hypothetical protein